MPWHILKGISQFLHTLSYSCQPYWPKVFHNTLIHIHNPASQTGQRPWVMYNTPSNTPSLCSNGLSPGYTYGISTLHDTRSAPVHYSLPQRSTNDTNTPCIFVQIADCFNVRFPYNYVNLFVEVLSSISGNAAGQSVNFMLNSLSSIF